MWSDWIIKQFSVVVVCTSRQTHITRRRTINLPSPHDLLFENMASIYSYRTVNSSILKWPSLDYLSTNCTLTWGFSHCRLLIYSGMKPVRFQLKENRDGHVSSSRKWKQSTVLYRAMRSLLFCMLLVFVKYAHWPLTYFFPHRPRKGHRD